MTVVMNKPLSSPGVGEAVSVFSKQEASTLPQKFTDVVRVIPNLSGPVFKMVLQEKLPLPGVKEGKTRDTREDASFVRTTDHTLWKWPLGALNAGAFSIMSVSDRRPVKSKSPRPDGIGSDLSLSGSQVSLVSRPRSVMGKASIRALSVSGPRPRRPMSAMPTLSYMDVAKRKRRPYSADSEPLVTHSSEHRIKTPTCISLTSDFMDHPFNTPIQDLDMDGDMEFSSSTLLSSHTSDQFGNAWIDVETKGPLLSNVDSFYQAYSTDNSSDLFCYSDISEEPTRSEKSLGEHIRTMAQFHLHSISIPSTDSSSQSKSPSTSVTITSTDKREHPRQEAVRESPEVDPKHMTTRELHFRMVESGLFLNSKQKSSQILNQSNPRVLSKTESFGCHDFIEEGEKSKTYSKEDAPFVQNKYTEDQLPGTSSFLSDFGSDRIKFWHTQNGLDLNTEKAVCSLDDVSFPEEHDVDSLNGDSRNSNEVLLSNMGADPLSPSNLKSNKDGWMKESVIPVRFQQWVSMCHSENSDDVKQSSQTFFRRGSQLTEFYPKQTIQDADCKVEEVSGETEIGDENYRDMENKHEVSNDTPFSDILDTNIFESENSNIALLKESQDATKPKEELLLDQSSNTNENFDISKTVNCSSLDLNSTDAKMPQTSEVLGCRAIVTVDSKEHVLQSVKSENQLLGKCVKKVATERNLEKKLCGKSLESSQHSLSSGSSPRRKGSIGTTQGSKKCIEKKRDGQCGTERTGLICSKRKNDSRFLHTQSKSTGTARKGTVNVFNQPPEENLPGESQSELASWMSLCSDQLENTNSQNSFSSKQQDIPPASSDRNSGKGDSPYEEILTILRVLEDNEDQSSSVQKILSKRGSTFQEASSQEAEKELLMTKSSSQNQDVPEADHLSQTSEVNEIIMSEDTPSTHADEIKDSFELDNKMKTCSPCPQNEPFHQVPSHRGELRDLLTFLDAVDQSCSSILQSNSQSPISRTQHCGSVNSPELEELLLMGQSDLAQEIISLRLSVEERDATIKLLRTALREQKENQERMDAVRSKELESCMRQVRIESESVVKRHQKFIDQLIADKKSLSERCESLIQESQQAEQKYSKSLSNLEEKHKVELQRMKDLTTATEKLKRERWVETKTKKIKELTVRGLEPELTRLTSQHEQEMSALRTLHAQEIEQIELRAARRASQQMETLREQLIQEKEDALAREREVLRQRMEKQQLLYEEEGAEQRRRLVAEVRREKDRIATLEARMETQFEERKRTLERDFEQERERLRREYADKTDEIHRKQQMEMSQLREVLKTEKDAWLENLQQQQKQALAQSTSEIREQLKRERDREIEVVIEKLENEASLSREEKEKAAENRLRRVRDQLTSELRDVESSLNSLKDKYSEVRAQLQEKEDKLVSIEIYNRSLQTQLLETQKVADQLSIERADLKQILRSEISIETEALRQQLNEQHSRHQQDLKVFADQAERERSNYQQELQQLYNRVKLAIAKKEEVVKAARAKQKLAEEERAHFQALLEQRRKESIL